MAEASTVDELYALVHSTDLEVEFGADLLDADETFLADLSQDLESFEVTRNVFRPIHGTCRFRLARNIQWQRHRVRPWVTLTSEVLDLTYTWTMGVWIPLVPDRVLGLDVETYDAQGWDKLILLDTPCGRTYTMFSGSSYLAAVNEILTFEIPNVGTWSLDGEQFDTVSTSDMTWEAGTTWLTIINDLLDAVGYAGMNADRDGTLRAVPYRQPAQRPNSWRYDAEDPDLSIVGVDRTFSRDTTDVPNVWVFTRRNVDHPVVGAGRVERVNQSDGDTSIDARGGRTVRVVVETDAVDDAALEVLADRRVIADKDIAAKLLLSTGPVPELWHLDVVELNDSFLAGVTRWAVEEWTLDLSGRSEMAHRWRQVVNV